MAISQAEAASALREVDATTARTIEARAYNYASPHLLLWGAVWIVGYAAMGVRPMEEWGFIWMALDFAGVAGSAAIGAHARTLARPAAVRPPSLGALVVSLLFIALFVAAVFTVFAPARPEPYLVFPALLLGLVYVVAGSWKMRRFAWIGAAVFVLAMIGFLMLKPYLAFWIAAVGGGGLVLGGLWLRKV
ncbi:MAG TPA: hypothetical protein VGB79_11170 [Allosphingosinicella sp.]